MFVTPLVRTSCSATVNVMVVVLPAPTAVPGAGLCVTTRFVEQLSVATMKPRRSGMTAAQPITEGAQLMMVGGWVSITFTAKLQELELPKPSTATQRTMVVPLGKVDPVNGLQLSVTLLHPSEALAA